MRERNENLAGRRFGRLVAVDRARVQSGKRVIAGWLCECDCGTRKAITTGELRQGLVVSCGCQRNERAAEMNASHGMSKQGGAYKSWVSMRRRCSSHDPVYYAYSGRGITVCERWSSFENFYADMGPRPPNGSLERVNVNGNYEPDNCVWIPLAEQAKNKTTSRFVTLNGERMIQADAARKLGVMPQTMNKWRVGTNRVPAGVDLQFEVTT